MYYNKITKEFEEKLKKLKILAEPSYNFLCDIVEGKLDGFWLSTSKNAHLYYEDKFLIYIVINMFDLEFHSNFNNRIETGTKDESSRIFSNINKLINELNGFNDNWAYRNDDCLCLKSKTPKIFYEKLVKLIRTTFSKIK